MVVVFIPLNQFTSSDEKIQTLTKKQIGFNLIFIHLFLMLNQQLAEQFSKLFYHQTVNFASFNPITAPHPYGMKWNNRLGLSASLLADRTQVKV